VIWAISRFTRIDSSSATPSAALISAFSAVSASRSAATTSGSGGPSAGGAAPITASRSLISESRGRKETLLLISSREISSRPRRISTSLASSSALASIFFSNSLVRKVSPSMTVRCSSTTAEPDLPSICAAAGCVRTAPAAAISSAIRSRRKDCLMRALGARSACGKRPRATKVILVARRAGKRPRRAQVGLAKSHGANLAIAARRA